MATSLEDALISVWRQVMAENAKTVTLNDESYPVRRTSRSKLREVDFQFEGAALRGVEQNATTNSRWAKLAREGKKVMQFLAQGHYVAVVVDGKATVYGALRERKE
jgi:fructose-1,6-bisphosphatase/inositol monophosphatase family enzyme